MRQNTCFHNPATAKIDKTIKIKFVMKYFGFYQILFGAIFFIFLGINAQATDFTKGLTKAVPVKNGSNHLLPTHCETIHLSFCEARWHGPYARHQPRPVLLTGVSSFWSWLFK